VGVLKVPALKCAYPLEKCYFHFLLRNCGWWGVLLYCVLLGGGVAGPYYP